MNKNLRVGLGVLLVLVGLIWTLQGLGYLKGSVMTGATRGAIIGPIVAILGVWLVARTVRAPRRARRTRGAQPGRLTPSLHPRSRRGQRDVGRRRRARPPGWWSAAPHPS